MYNSNTSRNENTESIRSNFARMLSVFLIVLNALNEKSTLQDILCL